MSTKGHFTFSPSNGDDTTTKRQVRNRPDETDLSNENVDETPLRDPEKKFDSWNVQGQRINERNTKKKINLEDIAFIRFKLDTGLAFRGVDRGPRTLVGARRATLKRLLGTGSGLGTSTRGRQRANWVRKLKKNYR